MPKLFVPRPTTDTSGPPSPRVRVRKRPTLSASRRPLRRSALPGAAAAEEAEQREDEHDDEDDPEDAHVLKTSKSPRRIRPARRAAVARARRRASSSGAS